MGHRMLVTTTHREEVEEILARAMRELGFKEIEDSVVRSCAISRPFQVVWHSESSEMKEELGRPSALEWWLRISNLRAS